MVSTCGGNHNGEPKELYYGVEGTDEVLNKKWTHWRCLASCYLNNSPFSDVAVNAY